MEYLDSREQAEEYAGTAVGLMQAHRVAPNPQNFRVFYEYASGRNPGLKRAVDIIISNGQEFSAAVLDDLNEQYFALGKEGEQVRSIAARVQESLGQIVHLIGEAGADNHQFGRRLVGLSGQVRNVANDGALQALIAQIAQETSAMAQRNAALEQRLNTSSSEITQLRQNLEEIRREASLDPLTGVNNRKSFDRGLTEAARQAMESGDDLCLLMIDIDHFKRFNDTWGHQVGDQVLKLVAKTISDNIKGQDLAARYGGEEFAVVLPRTAAEAAVIVGNNIREALMGKQLVKKSSGEDMGRITASIGVARFEFGESLSELIRRADEALYMAKRDGRNRVVRAEAHEHQLAAVGR